MNIPLNEINYISTPSLFSNIIKGTIAFSFLKERIDEADWVDYFHSHKDLQSSFSAEDLDGLKSHFVHNGIFEGRMIDTFPDDFLWLGKPTEQSNKIFVIGSLLHPYQYAIECFINLNSKFTSIRDHSPELFLDFLNKSGPYATLLEDSNISDRAELYFKPQSYYFFDENNNNICNFLLRFENLQKDLSFLQDLIKLDQHTHVFESHELGDYFTTNGHWDAVKNLYNSDFENFGYAK